MKSSRVEVEALEISVPRMGIIRVFLQDLGSGQGRMVVEFDNRAWSYFWPAMGKDLKTFLIESAPEEIEAHLHAGMRASREQVAHLTRIATKIQAALKKAKENR